MRKPWSVSRETINTQTFLYSSSQEDDTHFNASEQEFYDFEN